MRRLVPATPPALLPGRSANYWAGPQIIGCVIAFFGLVLIGLGSGLSPSDWGAAFVDLGVVALLAGAAWIGVATYFFRRRDGQERAAGYTTLHARFYWLYWQLDPKTGEVLRRPGETTTAPRDP